MKGLLLVNSFLKTQKFGDLYRFFADAARSFDITLDVLSSDRIYAPIGMLETPSYDFVLSWDKDLRLGKALENTGLRLFNSSEAVGLCDDKALTAEALVSHGIPTPKTMIAPKTFSNVGYANDDFLAHAEEYLSYPFVIKHRCGSFGAQVFLAHNRKEAMTICRNAGGNEVILQEFVSESAGKDLRVNVVGNAVKGVIYRHSESDFRSNITLGGKMDRYEADEKTCSLAIAAAHAVGCDFAGVDILFGKDGPIVCEVNASPHFKTTYECTGIDISKEILSHILNELG